MPAPKDLIHETSVTTGTGDFTVAAVNGKVGFSDATHGFGTGGSEVFDYYISNRDAAEWEIGRGHMSATSTLVRDAVVRSTNSNTAVNFSAGTKDVTNDIPAIQQFATDSTAKTTPIDADSVPLVDSAASNVPKRVTWANVKATLETYFDTLYQPLAAALTTLSTAFTPASASGPASLALHEDTDNGTNKVTLIAPASIASDKTVTFQDVTGTVYVSGGTNVAIADGGHGQDTAAAGFDALAPTTTRGDVIFRNATTNTRLPKGSSGQVLTMGSDDPAWATPAGATAASQAEQETGSSTTVFVTPGRQQYHASAAKFWVKHDNGTTMNASYNMTSITDHGTGDHTANIATDFSGSNWAACIACNNSGNATQADAVSSMAAGTLRHFVWRDDGGQDPMDVGSYYIVGFGDQ